MNKKKVKERQFDVTRRLAGNEPGSPPVKVHTLVDVSLHLFGSCTYILRDWLWHINAPLATDLVYNTTTSHRTTHNTHLRAAGHRAEGDLPELLLHEGPVRDAPDGHSLLGEHDGAVLAVEHEADDVLLRHLGQLLVENLLRYAR